MIVSMSPKSYSDGCLNSTSSVRTEFLVGNRMLRVLCASAGLRLGEALGIDIKNISSDCATVKITQKAWKSQVHDFLKTDNGRREIDLHSSVAAMLKEYIGERKSGLLFCSNTGKPLQQSNILRRSLHPTLAKINQPKCGSHAFRRFRLTWLRENAVPKDLEHFCMGHADQEIGDIYSQLETNVKFRKDVAKRIGLGFELPSKKAVVGPNGPKIESEPVLEMAASV